MARPKKSNVGNGFQKNRTIEQITAEYNQQCVLAGHKSRLLRAAHEQIIGLENEVKTHLEAANKLNTEGAKLQAALKLAQTQPLPPQPTPTAVETGNVLPA